MEEFTFRVDGNLDQLRQGIAETRKEMETASRVGRSFGNSLTRAFTDAAVRGKKLSDVAKNLALSLSQTAFKAAINPLGKAIGGSITSALTRALGFQKGGVLAHGTPVPFAKGGVIASPTTFPLSSGRTGLAGEAGPEVFTPLRTPRRNAPQSAPAIFGQSLVAFMDLPLLRGDEAAHAGYVAAYQSPWPGAVAFYRSPENTGYVIRALATGPATLGVSEQDFSSGPTGRFDRANICRVRLDNGDLQSVTELALLGGANTAAIENTDGDFEVFQFMDATLVAPSTYELTNLLRGQAGTEKAMADPVPSGARFVLLDSAVSQVDMTVDEIALDFNWQYGPISRDIGHASYQNQVRSFSGLGLRPLSPVHVRAKRTGNNIAFSWVRRTRLGGDSWDTSEVPLGEDTERYEVDVLDGEDVKRTLTSELPSISYSEADQITDWGTLQSSYDINVYQLSAAYGRGQRREAQINV